MSQVFNPSWAAKWQKGLENESLPRMEELLAPAASAQTEKPTLGPYSVSPIAGLHFETENDTAAS